ncbi:MAG: hypothetical protein JNM07_01600 [Phycisphaerae bacterium]|nr:hypothetical protein [Phycisphaerae bacterium]
MSNNPRTRNRSERTPARARMSAGVLVALALAGCGTAGSTVRDDLPRYPETLKQATTLDVQVAREETVVRMTNTTGRSFGACRMWINGWYARELNGFGVGETLELPLNEFTDRYGTSFRAGGFFATERADTLAQAQLEVGNELLGLIVIGQAE